MKIIIKYLLKSLLQKKLPTLLVLFSIAASASLIFANESFQRICAYKFYEADTRHAGNSDLFIMPKTDKDAPQWIDLSKLAPYSNDIAYISPFIITEAYYAPSIQDMYLFQVYGVTPQTFSQHMPCDLIAGSFEDFEGFKVIMGQQYAARYQLNVGDKLNLEIEGQTFEYTLAGIAAPQGIYLRELADGGTMLIPNATIAKLTGGVTNRIYLKVKDSNQLPALKESLTYEFSDFNVAYTIDRDLISAETSTYVMPFRISAVSVIFMSLFIICTGFGLIIENRIASLGIFRSLGATQKKIYFLLFLESILFGLVGGILGCGLGLVVLTVIKNIYFSSNTFSTSAPLLFGIKEISYALLVAVILSVGSAMYPILKLSKSSLKAIMLHLPEEKYTKKSKKWIIGLLFIALCIFITPLLTMNLISMITACTLATLALVGLVLCAPDCIRGVALLSKKMGVSQEIYLGIRNVSDHKVLSNNLKLYATMIGIVAFMVSIFYSLSYDLHDAYQTKYLFDISFNLRDTNPTDLEQLRQVQGVQSATGYYMTYEANELTSGAFINSLFGIENSDFFQYYAVNGLEQVEDAIGQLDDGNFIVTTEIMQSKFGFQLGDTMQIQFNNKIMDFVITGFVDTNHGIGHIGYISKGNFEALTGLTSFDNFVVKSAISPDQLKINIKQQFTRRLATIITNQEMETANADKVDSIFNAINCYTYFAVIVGIIGMINNFVGGFIERKRSLSLFKCMGMSRKSLSIMIFTESLVIGVLGGLMGLVTGFAMMSTIPKLVGILWGNVVIHPAQQVIGILAVSGMLTMLLISIIPIKSASQISIMANLRQN